MKQLIRLTTLFCSCAALALTAVAGPEPLPSGKEMKEVAPAPPPECNWTGFYIGVHTGGQWGHSENKDYDYNFGVPNGFDGPKPWGYDEAGVVGGGQVGYNFQWNWLLFGIEADGGYMNLDGDGTEPGSPGNDTRGESDSDWYFTIRGRLGIAFHHWLFYGTGGGIGVNYEKRVIDDCDIFALGGCGSERISARDEDFDWGWTAGAGIEYMFDCHWTFRVEYLRFELDREGFSGEGINFGGSYNFDGDTEGNIVRAALNYKF